MEELDCIERAMEEYMGWGAKALRSECRRLKATPTAQNKASYLATLRASLVVAGTIEATGVVQDPFLGADVVRKTVACVFRLLNVLFSDVFCAGVATLGDVATRQALDTHTLGSASSWWTEVTAAYNDEDNETFNALFHIKPEFSTIDPAAFRHHDSKKLWTIWKELTRDYREVDGRFTTSGNQAPFTAFQGGRMDVYYLHLLTTITRPNLHACIIQTLPEDVMADFLGSSSARKPAKPTPTKNGSRTDGVVDVLKDFANSEDKAVLTKRQISFFEESIVLKRQKNDRCEKEHEATMRAAAIRQKRDSGELLVTLQKNLREMRRELAALELQGLTPEDSEFADLKSCIAKLKSEMESCLS
uniref:Uncharacterized protein n=2 Tax=Phytophthora fragariae TaxID=53985 RepID=A0A6A3FA72_9STRA|nr:hypothetical protein PF009_g8929 [Phytophthora fragariae]